MLVIGWDGLGVLEKKAEDANGRFAPLSEILISSRFPLKLKSNNLRLTQQRPSYGFNVKKDSGWWCVWFRQTQRQPERQQLGHTLSAPWVSGCCTALIRLWFTSALCDHQSIQLTLTAVAWSGNMKQLHLYISLGPVSWNLLFSKMFLTCLHLCVGNGINHSPPPLSSVDFLSPQYYSLKSPLLSCFWFCHFAKERGETKVRKKEKDILLCGGNRLVEIQASSLVYSLTIKSGTEEQK